MSMIKKIAITASTMLFVLAQIFSFYVIYTGQKEKIELIRQYERKVMEKGVQQFRKKISYLTYQDSFQENVVTYCFRNEMPKNSALYLNGKELYNNSAYTFQVEKLNFDEKYMDIQAQNGTIEKLNEKYLVMYYEKYELGENSYIFCHVLDITYLYKKSYELILREILISVLISAGMTVILVILIKKITKPLEAILQQEFRIYVEITDGQKPSGQNLSGQNIANQEPSDENPSGQDTMGQESVSQELTSEGSYDKDLIEQNTSQEKINHQPRVIISGNNLQGSSLEAATSIMWNLSAKNCSSSRAVENMKVTLLSDNTDILFEKNV